MRLHFFIPFSFALHRQTPFASPELEKLLAAGRTEWRPIQLDTFFCTELGVKTLAGDSDFPLAAISLLGEPSAGEQSFQDNRWCMFADPVHLILQRDSFSLDVPVPLEVEAGEAGAIIEALNQHFAVDGLHFFMGTSGRWYLTHGDPAGIVTHHPELVAGRNIGPYLARGPDAAKWNQLTNEIQMLLFRHPVNHARESRGETPLNSLWFHGAGKLPETTDAEKIDIYGNFPLASGVASLAGHACKPLPESPAGLHAVNDAWLYLDPADGAVRSWLSFAMKMIKTGEASSIRLSLGAAGGVRTCLVKPVDLWKFWRKTRPVIEYFV
ncbi:hypothetical protein MTYP_02195 [Methylophilaceae bacterium]|nr:hypothetical protein MTYP_02195 [Methylophilaceae bacterium]